MTGSLSASLVPAASPPGGRALLCGSDGSCLSESAVGTLELCSAGGACLPVAACPPGQAHSAALGSCVDVGAECAPPVDHRVSRWDARGACAAREECETDWGWAGTRCESAAQGQLCGAPVDGRLSRVGPLGECREVDECEGAQVFSSSLGRCVTPGAVCGDALLRQISRVDAFGSCEPVEECESGWERTGGACLWAARGSACEATAEELAADAWRVFEYDVEGACVSTNRCVAEWDLNETGECEFSRKGAVCESGPRLFRFDGKKRCVPAECAPEYETDAAQQCVYKARGTACAPPGTDAMQVHNWTAAGACEGTGECKGAEHVLRDGVCAPKPVGCPAGFSPDGPAADGVCKRVFNMGPEGTRTIGFAAEATDKIRARYTLRKEPRYSDANYTVSGNVGVNGSQGGIRGSHSRQGGWVSGKTHYSFKAYQNDGTGTLEVWLKR